MTIVSKALSISPNRDASSLRAALLCASLFLHSLAYLHGVVMCVSLTLQRRRHRSKQNWKESEYGDLQSLFLPRSTSNETMKTELKKKYLPLSSSLSQKKNSGEEKKKLKAKPFAFSLLRLSLPPLALLFFSLLACGTAPRGLLSAFACERGDFGALTKKVSEVCDSH